MQFFSQYFCIVLEYLHKHYSDVLCHFCCYYLLFLQGLTEGQMVGFWQYRHIKSRSEASVSGSLKQVNFPSYSKGFVVHCANCNKWTASNIGVNLFKADVLCLFAHKTQIFFCHKRISFINYHISYVQ